MHSYIIQFFGYCDSHKEFMVIEFVGPLSFYEASNWLYGCGFQQITPTIWSRKKESCIIRPSMCSNVFDMLYAEIKPLYPESTTKIGERQEI